MPDLKFHPAADIFPLMTGDDFDALVEDIRKHGLRDPIHLLDGLVLDGRNRYRACLLARVKCKSQEVETDDPVAYVVSLNKHRRHMTPSQLAMAADNAREFYDEQAKERKKRKPADSVMADVPQQKGTSRDAAGKALGVGGRLVDLARKVRTEAEPEVTQAVEEGRLSVSAAADLAEEDSETQKDVAKAAKFSGGRYRNAAKQKAEPDVEEGKSRGVGVDRANEAINCLARIPKNDALRKRGFQIVTDWIKHNK